MIPASTPNRSDYTADGTLAIYPYTFPIQTQDQLQVLVEDVDGNITELDLDVDYMVSGDGEPTGGNIELVSAGQDWIEEATGFLINGWKLTIRMYPGIEQETDISNQAPFFEEVVETSLDRLTMQDLEQQDEIDRAIKIPATETPDGAGTTLPSAVTRAGKVLGFDSLGKPTLLGITGLDANVSSAELGDKLEYDGEKWINSAPIYVSGSLQGGGGAYGTFLPIWFGGIKLSLPTAGTWRIWGTWVLNPDVQSFFFHQFSKSNGQDTSTGQDSITTGTGVHLKAGLINSGTIETIEASQVTKAIVEIILAVPDAIDVYIVPVAKAVGDGPGNLSINGFAHAQRISLSTT